MQQEAHSATAEIARVVPQTNYITPKTELHIGYIFVADSIGLTSVNLMQSKAKKFRPMRKALAAAHAVGSEI